MTTGANADSGDCSLFNDTTLADVTIKFSGQQISAHKAILARKSKYFLRAFTGQFPVASSDEINLEDDDEAEAIRAMIRHIYDLPYDQMVEHNTDDAAAYSTNEDLMFHIHVFTVADKYDVPSSRAKVVTKFSDPMEASWESDNFAPSIRKLCGSSAAHLADNSLKLTAAAFCAKYLTKLVKKSDFVEMIEQEEPFAGRLVTNFLRSAEDSHLTIKTCQKPACLARKTVSTHNESSTEYCNHCGCANSYDSHTGRYSSLLPFKSICFRDL